MSQVQSRCDRWLAFFQGYHVCFCESNQKVGERLLGPRIAKGCGKHFHVKYGLDQCNSQEEVGEFTGIAP